MLAARIDFSPVSQSRRRWDSNSACVIGIGKPPKSASRAWEKTLGQQAVCYMQQLKFLNWQPLLLRKKMSIA
jgi:hypothetical protein